MTGPRASLPVALSILGLALATGGVFSLATGGRTDVGLPALLTVFGSGDDIPTTVMREIRLPRMFAAAFLGVNLGLAGLILQAITRNPLAAPSILGINQGAALGLTLALIFPGLPSPDLLAIIGALAAGLLTFAISGGFSGRMDPLRLILGGIAVGAFAYAAVRFSFTLDDDISRQVVRWTVGDITDIRWSETRHLATFALPGVLLAMLLAHRLNLMALGQSSAQGLGADPRVTLLAGTLLAATLTGVSVATAGPIAFTGLVTPHLARMLAGPDHRRLIPATALTGAALMLAADGLSKWLTAPAEAPIGVVAAMIGAPWFLWQTLTAKDLG